MFQVGITNKRALLSVEMFFSTFSGREGQRHFPAPPLSRTQSAQSVHALITNHIRSVARQIRPDAATTMPTLTELTGISIHWQPYHADESCFRLGENRHAELTAEGLGDALLALFDTLVRGLDDARLRDFVDDVLAEGGRAHLAAGAGGGQKGRANAGSVAVGSCRSRQRGRTRLHGSMGRTGAVRGGTSPGRRSRVRWPLGLSRLVCMADVSDSMSGTLMHVAIALGILVSEVCHPAFRNKLLTFSSDPV